MKCENIFKNVRHMLLISLLRNNRSPNKHATFQSFFCSVFYTWLQSDFEQASSKNKSYSMLKSFSRKLE